ncbi:MAG: FAD-dependent monooxygenase [Sphingomonadales bacterium]|nr:FAD-dependent monooxygenase [Sphingomonadales bacterium]
MAAEFDCDILIIGGGPTGVTLGLLLARAGVSVIIAEKEADIYPLPRAAHLDHERSCASSKKRAWRTR